MKMGVKKLSFVFATLTAATLFTGCATNYSARSSGQTAEDKVVADAVLKALVNDPTFSYSHVYVNTTDGNTKLSGNAHSWEAVEHAANVAMFTKGVDRIQNNIEQIRNGN
jgi:osmotically-inducible protein OsmY